MPTTILTHGRVTWTDIAQPTGADIQALAQRYPHFHPLNLQDCLTELEIPKLDHHDEYLFLVVQFPLWEAGEDLPRPAEVDIFVARGTLVTSHHQQAPALAELFERARQDENDRATMMGSGASPLLYTLLTTLVDACFPIQARIEHQLRQLERDLFHKELRAVLNEIAGLRRAIIALRHTLKPQVAVVNSLQRGSWAFIHEELDLYWSDIGDHLAQLVAMLEENAEVIAGLSETLDTLASHRIDEVVRLLTIVTVLTLPLTLLATLFGMNIVLPYGEHPLLFYALTLLGLAFTAWIVWYLRKRRWL